MKFKNFSWIVLLNFFILVSSNATAQEMFEFKVGDKVHVLSDKGYRRTRENTFEAIGNVVITHKNKALYGEKATMSMNTGETKVIGNVRYVGPLMTAYGSELDYNYVTDKITIQNARILADDYIVLGKEISRISTNVITGVDAEYTTCKDCPESWSIFGRKVRIVLGEYIYITHAFIKSRGVVVMYLPYLVLPIKKDRETGLLFPRFGFSSDDGMRYQQPWFWNISNSQDLTLIPSVWGKRGLGQELQYRKDFGQNKWLEVNSVHLRDRVYEPFKIDNTETPNKKLRHFSDYEHQWAFGNSVNHHMYYNLVSDLDLLRDFDYYTGGRVQGTEFGGGGFVEYRNTLFDFNVESYFNRNLLVADPGEFDHDYVQILPRLTVSSTPFHLVQSDYLFLQDISFGVDGDYTLFKQNHPQADPVIIRNAHRVNASPHIDWRLGQFGPIFLKTNVKWDYQTYKFPYETRERSFSKSGMVYESEATIEIEKIFNLSYIESIPMERIDLSKSELKDENEGNKNKKTKIDSNNIVGKVPEFTSSFVKNKLTRSHNSYRHTQQFKIKHYYLGGQKTQGSAKFRSQINSSTGLFDPMDAIRAQASELPDGQATAALPLSNTFELQWNNYLVRKQPGNFDSMTDDRYLRDNFSYNQVAYFIVSQGYDMNIEVPKAEDRLTRLAVSTGISLKQLSLSASEYYIWKTDEHVTALSLARKFEDGSLSVSYVYDGISTPIQKYLSGAVEYRPLETIGLGYSSNYDIDEKRTLSSTYVLNYIPRNNCWKVEIQHIKTPLDAKTFVNFLFNFGRNRFTSLSGN